MTWGNKWGVATLRNSNTHWNKPKVMKKKKQLTNYQGKKNVKQLRRLKRPLTKKKIKVFKV